MVNIYPPVISQVEKGVLLHCTVNGLDVTNCLGWISYNTWSWHTMLCFIHNCLWFNCWLVNRPLLLKNGIQLREWFVLRVQASEYIQMRHLYDKYLFTSVQNSWETIRCTHFNVQCTVPAFVPWRIDDTTLGWRVLIWWIYLSVSCPQLWLLLTIK